RCRRLRHRWNLRRRRLLEPWRIGPLRVDLVASQAVPELVSADTETTGCRKHIAACLPEGLQDARAFTADETLVRGDAVIGIDTTGHGRLAMGGRELPAGCRGRFAAGCDR